MKNIIYSKFSNDRSVETSIITDIVEDGQKKYVVKKAASPKSQAHIDNMYKCCNALKTQFKDTKLNITNCLIQNQNLVFDYVDGESFEEIVDNYLLNFGKDQAIELIESYLSLIKSVMSSEKFEMTDSFKKVFGEVKFTKEYKSAVVSDIDMVLQNVIISENSGYLIDYEWTFNFPIPVDYIIFRILHYYVLTSPSRQILQEYYETYFDQKERNTFEAMEHSFQTYVKGTSISLSDFYVNGIGKGRYNAAELIESTRKIVKIYADYGNGYTEADTQNKYMINNNHDQYFINIDVDKNVSSYRIDPTENACIIGDIHVSDENNKNISFTIKGECFDSNMYICENDPWIEIIINEINVQKLQISFLMIEDCDKILKFVKSDLIFRKEQQEKNDDLNRNLQDVMNRNDNLDKELQKAIDDNLRLSEDLKNSQNNVSNLSEQNAELIQTISELQNANQMILNSASWKISKPIRVVGNITKKITGMVSTKK